MIEELQGSHSLGPILSLLADVPWKSCCARGIHDANVYIACFCQYCGWVSKYDPTEYGTVQLRMFLKGQCNEVGRVAAWRPQRIAGRG